MSRRSLHFLDYFQHSTQFYCLVTDAAGAIILANDLASRCLNLQGLRLPEISRASLEANDPFSLSCPLEQNDGRPVFLCWEVMPLAGAAAGYYRWMAAAQARTGSQSQQRQMPETSYWPEARVLDEKLHYQSTILEHVSDIIIITDTDLRIRSANSIAKNFFQLDRDPNGVLLSELITRNGNAGWAESLKGLSDSGRWKGELMYVHANGARSFLLNTLTYICDEQQNKIGIIMVGHDITDRKEMENQLQKSEQFYRNLFSDSLNGMLLMNEAGLITYVSGSVEAILGYNMNEVIGTCGFDYVHPQDQELASHAFFLEVEETPEVKFIVIRLLKKNGEWLWCMVRGHNLLSNPHVGNVVVYFHDDTLRKQAIDALKESEERFRALIRDLQVGVLLQDAEGRILMCNSVTLKIAGTSNENLVGRFFWEVFHDVINEEGNPIQDSERPVRKALTTKTAVKDVVLGLKRKASDERIWLIANADPILNEDGTIRHIVSSVTDITERKKLEQKLLLEQLSHQKQLTQATIDGQERERKEIGKELHDNIGQQLTTIKLYLELAEAAEGARVYEMVRQAARNVGQVIDSVRGISRSLLPSILGDLGLIDSINELVDSFCRMQSLDIRFDPAGFEEERLPENKKLMLFRILQEQLNNIARHAGASFVEIGLMNVADGCILKVNDDGCGFDPQQVQWGVGLTNMRNRAELLGGRLDVFSHPGGGCTIRVFLPHAFQDEGSSRSTGRSHTDMDSGKDGLTAFDSLDFTAFLLPL